MGNEIELVSFGGSVKALGIQGDTACVGGYLVLFGNAEQHDATPYKDWFASDTDYDIGAGARSSVYYHHGLDPEIKKRKLGEATLTLDGVGIWAEAQIKLRDAYDQAIYQLAKDGKLGWSSGTATHLVERQDSGGGTHKIVRWPLGLDASLTPTPAEPRSVVEIKSLQVSPLEVKAFASALPAEHKLFGVSLSGFTDAQYEAVKAAVGMVKNKRSNFSRP